MSTLVIYDEEEGYVRNLMEYMSDKKGLPFKVTAFSNFSRFEKYMKDRGTDMLLAPRQIVEKLDSSIKVEKEILLLSGDILGETEDFPCVFKYQSADNITDELLRIYSELSENSVVADGKKAELTAIYSPIGRCGKTSMAITLGQILSCEKHVLYINMEEFSGLEKLTDIYATKDLSDLMYYYRISPDALMTRFKEIVQNVHGMDYIPSMKYSADLRNVDIRYWKGLLMWLAKIDLYDYIIVDLSDMLGDVFEILGECDRVYMPIKSDRNSMCKINAFEEYLLGTDREDIISKTIKVQLPELKSQNWEEDFIDQLVWSELGDYVRRMLDSLEFSEKG